MNNYLTVSEIMKLTGKSQSTILRFIREKKKTHKKDVQLEKVGLTRQYKVSLELIKKHFVLEKKEATEQKTHQTTDQTGWNIPRGYVVVDEKTMTDLRGQLNAKDEQIKRQQEVNYQQSVAIANMKMLGSGKKEDKKEKEGEILEEKERATKKKVVTPAKSKKQPKKRKPQPNLTKEKKTPEAKKKKKKKSWWAWLFEEE